jgi:hypothetical protein
MERMTQLDQFVLLGSLVAVPTQRVHEGPSFWWGYRMLGPGSQQFLVILPLLD